MRMGIREKVEKHSAVFTVIAIAVIVLAIAASVRGMRGTTSNSGAPDKTQYFFVDPESGKLSAFATPISPVSQSGKELFRAYVYSCSSCSDASSRFVGYIEKLSPERHEKETQMRIGLTPGETLPPSARAQLQALGGQFISAPSPVEWVDPASPDAEKIVTALRSQCPGIPLPCSPEQ